MKISLLRIIMKLKHPQKWEGSKGGEPKKILEIFD